MRTNRGDLRTSWRKEEEEEAPRYEDSDVTCWGQQTPAPTSLLAAQPTSDAKLHSALPRLAQMTAICAAMRSHKHLLMRRRRGGELEANSVMARS